MLLDCACLCLSSCIHLFGTQGRCHFPREKPDRNPVWELIIWLSSTAIPSNNHARAEASRLPPLRLSEILLVPPKAVASLSLTRTAVKEILSNSGFGQGWRKHRFNCLSWTAGQNLSNDWLHNWYCKVWVLRGWSSKYMKSLETALLSEGNYCQGQTGEGKHKQSHEAWDEQAQRNSRAMESSIGMIPFIWILEKKGIQGLKSTGTGACCQCPSMG